MNWEWNGKEWTVSSEREDGAENFDWRVAYVRMDDYGVLKTLMSGTSNGMIGRVTIGLSVLKCVQRRHVEYLCVCVRGLFVVVSWSQNVHLLDAHVHVMFLLCNIRVCSIRDFHHEQLVLVASRQYRQSL